MRDNWAVGFSRRYTVAVWVGNAGGESMWDVSGMHGAAPVWLALLDHLQRSAPSQPPTAPAGVTRRTVRYQDGIEAGRHEWFLAGTERDRQVNQPAGIAAPLDGSVFALDPDIPPANQRLLLRARGVNAPQWWMDGKMIGRGAPYPGCPGRDDTRWS
ncbi:hypothetical protein [Crenobacter cavernae]|uniref:hypothetical protein n=1 Tax=Crenobacter cavernae TaxID=2290923 RepID=UPI001C6A3CDB|nr:hypothetical protein [Crenobacter cavernae]